MYRKISNTIRTLVQYAPQTFTGELWENVSLAVQYAPVLCPRRRQCRRRHRQRESRAA